MQLMSDENILLMYVSTKISNFAKRDMVFLNHCGRLKLTVCVPVRISTWLPRPYPREPDIV